METGNLQGKMEALFDYLYANAPVRTPIAIWEEVQKVLQAGVYIEQVSGVRPAFGFSRSELAHLSRFKEPITTAVVSRVRNEYVNLNKQVRTFSEGNGISLRDPDIAMVCIAMSGIHLSSLQRDVIGEALEVFRHNWVKRNGGQFFTDPAVTRLAIELLDFDPNEGHELIDLAAGTGGFLLAAANCIRKKLTRDADDPTSSDSKFSYLVKRSLKGVEIDESLAEIANMTIGARVGEFDFRPVTVGDSLDPNNLGQLSEIGIKNAAHLRAATNPPFGMKIAVRDPAILANYKSAYLRNHNTSPSPTSLEILFLERNLQILKPRHGCLAIVLPYQLTSGPQARPVREWLLRHAELKVVVDLPAETFQPYTGTKTCLVILRRRLEPLESFQNVADGRIFMSVPRWIGHDRRGKPIYATSPDGSPTTKILCDMDEVARAYHKFLCGDRPEKVHSGSFSVDANQIFRDSQLRFNARFFRPNGLLHTVSKVSKSSTWQSVKLGSVADRIFFPGRFKRRYVPESVDAVPFLGGTNISQYVPTIQKWLSRSDPIVENLQVFPGWVLITRSGSTGIVSLVPDHWAGWTVSEHVIRVVPNEDLIHPSYLEAYLRTRFAKASIHRGVFGSVIDEITPEFLSEVEILIPESEELRNRITEEAQLAKNARDQAIESISRAVDMIEEAVIQSSR